LGKRLFAVTLAQYAAEEARQKVEKAKTSKER
jgi:hypothetical protein